MKKSHCLAPITMAVPNGLVIRVYPRDFFVVGSIDDIALNTSVNFAQCGGYLNLPMQMGQYENMHARVHHISEFSRVRERGGRGSEEEEGERMEERG